MLGRGGPPAVDRLEVVADHGQLAVALAQAPDDLHLEAVHVLVLVDQQVLDSGLHGGSDHLVGGEPAPVEQQVV